MFVILEMMPIYRYRYVDTTNLPGAFGFFLRKQGALEQQFLAAARKVQNNFREAGLIDTCCCLDRKVFRISTQTVQVYLAQTKIVMYF